MTNLKKQAGLFSFVAVAAILSGLLIVANVGQEVTAENGMPAKKGYTGDSTLQVVTEEQSRDNVEQRNEQIIEEFYFKTNAGGDIVWDLTLECATATHVQGKSTKKNTWEEASVDGNVWFEVLYEGETEWKRIPFKGEAGDVADKNDGVWNLCSQTFAIKTNLNDLIEEVDVIDPETGDVIGTELQFACEDTSDTGDHDGDGTPNIDDVDFAGDCLQFIDLFLENAGTHPAKAVLKNIPNGIHKGKVLAEVVVENQDGLIVDTGADGDGDYQTALTFGNRLLILEDIHIIESHDQ
jgi:hypothetical protein